MTTPISAQWSSQRAQTSSTAASRSGETTATIRSWLSEIMISTGSRSGSRSGTRSRCTSMPGAAAVGHLGQRGGQPCRAEVLERLDEAALDQLEARLDQLLARERVADLHGGALVLVLVGELLARQDARAADPVAAGGGAVEDDEVAGAARAARA